MLIEFSAIFHLNFFNKIISMHIRHLIVLSVLFFSTSLFAQSQRWSPLSSDDINRLNLEDQQIKPNEYKAFSVNFSELQEFLDKNQHSNFTLDIPFPDGSIQSFECTKAGLIPEGLQKKFPSILSFDGEGKSIRGSSMKFGISPKGFHAMIFQQGVSPIFIDILTPGMTSYYMSYHKSNYNQQNMFSCNFTGENNVDEISEFENKSFAGDCQLRSYRLALACTGEYAAFHGGTVESTLAEYAIAMARVNGVYEKDLGITMILIENTDEVIFLDGGSDPYTNNSGGVMLGENQETLDDVIGTANYDIGHVFSTGGGGIASLQSPCNNNRKAQGVTGLPSPINDPFYVDYVCHEMGHQFGANHTQNNDCNRVQATAMEVGSANTIMGYAGICNPNSKFNSDDHFHAISIFEITNFIVNGNGNSCDELIAIENTPPTVTVSQSTYNIPKDTPFMLTAIANDADGDVMTYCWEQMDNEIANMPPELTNTGGPAFISNSPLLSDTRVFPNMTSIVNNLAPEWEVLPNVAREMNFRVTVRDNKSLLGCTAETDILLNVDGDVGPFLVEYPNTNVSWQSTMEETIEWDVANTDGGTVNCALVDILLSVDGGFEYPIVLAEQVPNDGSHVIIVPPEFTNTARVMVKCENNVFFDISNTNFSIETPFTFVLDNETLTVCEGESANVEISTEGFNGFAEEILFSVEDAPSDIDFSFSNNPINVPEATSLSLSNINTAPGIYTINIVGSSPSIDITKNITLIVEPSTVDEITLQSPENGAIEVALNTVLEWEEVSGINEYEIQVSKSPSFTDPLTFNVSDITSTPLTDLESNTVYYWRININSPCLDPLDSTSELFAFQTQREGICNSINSDNLPLVIPDDETGDFQAVLEVSDVSDFAYMQCYIDLEHTYLGDIIYTLVSPQGTEIILMDQLGVPGSQFGCSTDDIAVTFSDLSTNTADMLESICDNFENDYQPVQSFSAFMNEDVNGEWTLIVTDVFDEDGGQVVDWSLEFCEVPDLGEANLVNEALVVPFNNQREITNTELQVEIDNPLNSTFTLLTTPEHGELQYTNPDGMMEVMSIGSTFTQEDINESKIIYVHNGNNETTDSFQFDAIDASNRWSHDNTFNIIILMDGQAVVIPQIVSPILCNGDETASIEIEIINGNGPFMYSIDGGENYVDNGNFVDLGADQYTIVVQDVNGFEIYNETLEITEPEVLSVTATSDFYNIVATGIGGTEGYTYSLNGVDFVSESLFENIAPNDYTVTIRDANGCESTIDVSHNYSLLEISSNVEDILCYADFTGIIEVLGAGGFEPYMYSFDGIAFDDEGIYQDLPADTYTIYIQDAGGMILSQEVTITEQDEIIFTLLANSTDFTVENISGGVAPYEFSLNNADYVDISSSLDIPSGDFTIYVRDANGCIKPLNYVEIGAQVNASNTLCVDEATGSFTADGFGGFPPLSYSFDGINFQDSDTFMDLAADTYTLTIRDAFGFLNTVEVTIGSPDPIVVTTFFDGDLTINATGGTGSYMYSIDGGMTFQSSNVFEITMDGDYPIVVIDSNDCVDESMLTISLVDNENIEIEDLITIYPIPVTEILTVEIDASIVLNSTIKMFNIIGQQMDYVAEQNNNQYLIDMTNWTLGQYVLVIETEGAVVTKKVLKF